MGGRKPYEQTNDGEPDGGREGESERRNIDQNRSFIFLFRISIQANVCLFLSLVP